MRKYDIKAILLFMLFITSSSVSADSVDYVVRDPFFISIICIFIGFVSLMFLIILVRRCCCKRGLITYENAIVAGQSRTWIPPPQETTPFLSPGIVYVNSPTAPGMPRPRQPEAHGSDNYGYAPPVGEPPPPYNATPSAPSTHYNTLVPEYGAAPPKYQF